MVPFEKQTEQIVEALFHELTKEQSGTTFFSLEYKITTKSNTGPSASSFDPCLIARSLQRLGDQYNAEVEAKAQEILQEKKENMLKKFRETAEVVCRSSGVGYELSFLAVAVKLFQCLVRNDHAAVEPDLLIQTINGNLEVRGYIERHGGWENFGNRRGQDEP